MTTLLIMFSVFFTGAIVARKDAGSSNTLMLLAILCLLTMGGIYGYGTLRP